MGWGCMHAAQMLSKQILAVEIIVINSSGVVAVHRHRAQITTPVSEPDMLSADMSLPFVLGRKG